MTHTDMNVAEFKKDDYNLIDYYSKGKLHPATDVDLGGVDDLYNHKYSFINNMHTLSYNRKLVTNDMYDFKIPLVINFN